MALVFVKPDDPADPSDTVPYARWWKMREMRDAAELAKDQLETENAAKDAEIARLHGLVVQGKWRARQKRAEYRALEAKFAKVAKLKDLIPKGHK